MFDRFIRLARAKRALQEQRFEDALQLAADPLIQPDRRAEAIRKAAAKALSQRAKRHLDAGDIALASRDLERLRDHDPQGSVVALGEAVAAAALAQQAGRDRGAAAVSAARSAIDEGRLDEARGHIASLAEPFVAERRMLEVAVAERRRRAIDMARQATSLLTAGAVEEAVEQLVRAQLLDRDGSEVAELRASATAGVGARLAISLAALADHGDLEGALAGYRRACRALPPLTGHPDMQAWAGRAADAIGEALRATPGLAAACRLAQAARAADIPCATATQVLLDALLAVDHSTESVGTTTMDAVTANALVVAARACGASSLVSAAEFWMRAADDRASCLAAVRHAIDGGDFDRAQALLDPVVAVDPLHEEVRREQAAIAAAVVGLEAKLADVRAALQVGQLRQACAAAAGVVGLSRLTTEAQRLAADARAKMALVDRGLDEVRVALHGRAAATVEGVRHCLRRLEELAKVQADHPELPAVIEAVRAEIDALSGCEVASGFLDRGQLHEGGQAVASLLPFRSRLLAPERLDARLCDLTDRLARLIDVALAAGRLGEVEHNADIVQLVGGIRADYLARAGEWRRAVADRQQAARALLESARRCLAARDLAGAEQAVERAQMQWLDGNEAREFAAELRTCRQQSEALERVETLAKDRDYQGARAKLAAMAAVTPMLRTRIYDMKQNLARAQGLEGAFLLRVDEGGEQLVLRGETISLGNVRNARADLPVLANLAGRHASVRRSMSFHGGMQDSIVAEEGDVMVGGRKVTSHALASGDRVQLGGSFGFVYRRPTARSLTVSLTLQSGFQVGGTDRILLMKDRGRDGRILIGTGGDVHVRVARATGEVEVFATSSGQIRVAAAEGTIDGVPFRGEHPIAAGQIVQAAGTSFLLLPWRPDA